MIVFLEMFKRDSHSCLAISFDNVELTLSLLV